MDQFLQVFFFYLILFQDREKKIADQPRASIQTVNLTNQLVLSAKLQNCRKVTIRIYSNFTIKFIL